MSLMELDVQPHILTVNLVNNLDNIKTHLESMTALLLIIWSNALIITKKLIHTRSMRNRYGSDL